MRDTEKIAVGLGAGLGGAVSLGWLGLQVPPAPFPAYPGGAAHFDTAELPRDLPAPVERYLRAVVGDRLPIIESAVLTGRGRLRLGPVAFPARLRFVEAVDLGYRHYIECTWFGLPLSRVNEWYRGGHLRQELPVGVIADEPKADQAANLAFWGELAFWLPFAPYGGPRARWEPIDATTARLVVPFGPGEDRLTVAFDGRNGLLRWIEAPRYRTPSDAAKIPWRVEALGWRTFPGIRIPTPVALTWQDQGTPWLVVDIEDVAFNVDVSTSIRARGP